MSARVETWIPSLLIQLSVSHGSSVNINRFGEMRERFRRIVRPTACDILHLQRRKARLSSLAEEPVAETRRLNAEYSFRSLDNSAFNVLFF